MKFSMTTTCLGGSLEDKFSAISAAGYQGVEVFNRDLSAFEGSASDARNMAADLGLEIMAFGPFRDFEGAPKSERAEIFQRARKKFSLMNELGASRLLICSNTSPSCSGDISRIAADLNELGDIADQFDIEVGYEALSWGRHVWDYRKAWEAVQLADHSAVSIVIDNWHIMALELPLQPIQDIPAEKVMFVQLADAPIMQLDLLEWSRHYRCFPGQGDWDLGEFISVLEDIGFDGWISQEIFNDEFLLADPKTVAMDGMQSFHSLFKTS